MFLKFLVYINFFEIFILIHANQQFHFGIINHRTQWNFHCPGNITKLLEPPLNDQPLISYECPHRSSAIEILPIEVDFTFLCRLQSRLVWFIIDLYQYNTYFWLINHNDIEIQVNLNNEIELNNSKIELKNYTNRFIIINAFYIPFESINNLLRKSIEINIQIKNLYQLNQCQFRIKDNYLWKIFIENNCDLDQSKTYSIQYAKCDFYSKNNFSFDKNLQIDILSTNTFIDQSTKINFEQNLTTNLIPYHHHHHHYYLLLQENYRQILSKLSHSINNTILLKLTFLFLLIILILLILFFLYMLCYHYHNRLRSSSSLVKETSVSI